MVDERESPSAGWREVYREMDADTGVEAATRPCPDCGRACENVARDVYDCEKHGLFRADDEESSSHATESDASARDECDSPDADDPDETTNRTRWSAGPV